MQLELCMHDALDVRLISLDTRFAALVLPCVELPPVAVYAPPMQVTSTANHASPGPLVEGQSLADAALERMASRRTPEDFRMLYEHFSPRLFAYFSKRGQDRVGAADLVQEVMLRMWQQAHRFDRRKGRASTWVFRIARNAHIDSGRRASLMVMSSDDPAWVPDTAPEQDAVLGMQMAGERLRNAIDALPPEQGEALRAVYFGDASFADVAAHADVSVGTMKTRVRLALEKLRRASAMLKGGQ